MAVKLFYETKYVFTIQNVLHFQKPFFTYMGAINAESDALN